MTNREQIQGMMRQHHRMISDAEEHLRKQTELAKWYLENVVRKSCNHSATFRNESQEAGSWSQCADCGAEIR